ncbi:oxygen-insensitive NADPH nitroreductase [Psychromonas antarctica]|jgi:FMN reductase (NADPH)|uniref:oxygen-insensitive NADPH nitroreductase n=1 Tax=Psychromonas antarctica TaxID=67573 RepID=UPI001EE84813|nr:oxygen-insensitive NADPH nitroreductase [Psychromonas antarctica]MCG6202595.1 oxygen-insensitive NADPH nitroreductase [Psychromonas antarctica]
MNQIIDLLKNHRSIRKFTPEPISNEKVHAIIEAAGSAATSNMIQAYSVIRVLDKGNRKQLAKLAGSQTWVEQCPVFLVFCADLKRAENACFFENKEMASGFTEQFLIATVDVSLAAQNAMIAAESLGLGGVFIGGIRNEPEKVCELLNIPEHVFPIFGMCIGYPDEKPEQKPRLPVNVVLKEEYYQESESDLERYNDICNEYYKSRSNGSRDDTWTRQISKMVSVPLRPHMKEFLNKRGFAVK